MDRFFLLFDVCPQLHCVCHWQYMWVFCAGPADLNAFRQNRHRMVFLQPVCSLLSGVYLILLSFSSNFTGGAEGHHSIRSYTIKIFFPSNSFSRSRHLKSNWYQTIFVDLFPSGDPFPGVLKMHYFPIVIFCDAGGLLFLCSGDAFFINDLRSLGLNCMKN